MAKTNHFNLGLWMLSSTVVLAGAASMLNANPSSTGPSGVDVAKAMKRMEELGARIGIDDKRSDRPVISLTLHGGDVTDADLRLLRNFPQLEELNLRWGAKFTDSGLQHLKNLNHLRKLDLSNAGVTDAGLEQIAEIHGLKRLDLAFTQVTDEGLVHLEALNQLEELFLRGTSITDAGLQHLGAMKQLRRIDLKDTKITDAGLDSLIGLDQLRSLLLNGIVSNEGTKKLQRSLPNCRVMRGVK